MKEGPILSKSDRKRLDQPLWEEQDPLLQTLSNYKDANTRNHTASSPSKDKFLSNVLDTDFSTKASLDLPLRWKNNRLGVKKDIKTNLTCVIPPSANGRWSATLHGSSIVRGPMGTANGSMNIMYRLSSSSRIRGGLQVGDQTHLLLGGTIMRNTKSSLDVSLISRPKAPLMTVLSAHQKLDACRVDAKCTLAGVVALHNWNVSVSTLATHSVTLGMGWHRSQPLLSMRLVPKISSLRKGSVSIQWRPSGWGVGAVLNQSLEKLSSLGIGIRVSSKKRLEWIFTWNRGDVTIRVPVIISPYADAWMYSLQATGLSLLSELIQDLVYKLFHVNESKSRQLLEAQQGMKRQKARADAEQQQKLMLQQAASRVKQEQSKDGLVIHRAIYQAQGGDSWDVTTQLQFWTDNSSLQLPATSKQHLLGFYNVANGTSSNGPNEPWWMGLWKETDSSESSSPVTPTLTVHYYFAKRSYEITILDEEPLLLPNSKAVPIEN